MPLLPKEEPALTEELPLLSALMTELPGEVGHRRRVVVELPRVEALLRVEQGLPSREQTPLPREEGLLSREVSALSVLRGQPPEEWDEHP